MTRSTTKIQRILQIEALLLAHPEGLTQSEIARRLNVNRSTVHRYLPDLTHHASVFEEDGRLFIDREAYLLDLKLNLHEALSLHLAIRLLTNRLERHNPHSASLLRKLSGAIEKLTPQISHHLTLSADVIDDPERLKDPHFISVLEKLTAAWAEGRKVRLWHRHVESSQVYEYLFSTYFIEPYAVGQSIHVIGMRNPPGEIRTFNLVRIERIELTKEHYQVPEEFDPTELLKSAWGIWYADSDPQEIILKFSPNVVKRVMETQWHFSQQVAQQDDGSVLWRAEIAEPQEMIPWIRGWGADCEVIAPTSLRYRLINELTRLQDMYVSTESKPYLALWAKFQRGDETNWHALLWHMIDTAAVVKCLWNDCLAQSFKARLASIFNTSVEETGKMVMFWAALHDIGKASPDFQKKNSPRQMVLKSMGFNFPSSRFDVDGFHATGTTLILRDLFEKEVQAMPRKFRIDLASALGGHHGEFPNDQTIIKTDLQIHHVGDEKWQDVQKTLFSLLEKFFDVHHPENYPQDLSDTNPLFLLLTGLTTTADWIASNEQYFPYLNAELQLEDYYAIAEVQAKDALRAMGWYGWKSSKNLVSFNDIFPDFTPNTIQKAVIDEAKNLEAPFLAIIEAPTGSGKTEAAFYLADRILQRDQLAGIYIAMPTQATSNQMFSRTVKFLAKRYSEDEINLHLVHGAALLDSKDTQLKPTGIWGEGQPEISNIHSHAWFLPRKRTLLAPFGVGTVDQTFLSVLTSKHFFLRLFGLSHKILIFDEVHAYDIYMTEIFKTLLHWLKAVGTSVIILSATLPHATRQDLLQAYHGGNVTLNKVEYPRISFASDDDVEVINPGKFPSRVIQLSLISKDVEEILEVLKDKLSNGGCAAVICNRVKRAQDLFVAVQAAFPGDETQVLLFHSQFPHVWRKDIEECVLTWYGKGSLSRPHRSIIVSTQVIEQSLDLDFDLLISDLAPIDLLIQRIGRLHRHSNASSPPNRPDNLVDPHCIVAVPEAKVEDSDIDFGADSYIYSPYFLYRTLLVLNDREFLVLPDETDSLIEKVYSLERMPGLPDQAWSVIKTMQSKMLEKQSQSARNAHNYLIPLSEDVILGRVVSPLSDNIHGVSKRILRAPTREINPSVDIVCLYKQDQEIYILGNPLPVDLDEPLTYDQIQSCLKAVVTISNWRVVKYFLQAGDNIPESFRTNAATRWCFPVVFENGIFASDEFSLHLDREKGLQVIVG